MSGPHGVRGAHRWLGSIATASYTDGHRHFAGGTLMAKSEKLSKKVAKLEKKADGLRKQAEKKGKKLSSQASDTFDSLAKDAKARVGKEDEEKSGGKGKFALLLAVLAGVAVALKRKRDQELDEALWEEPRSV